MENDKIKQRAEKIEEIYQEYIQKMGELKKEQDKILEEFLHELEKAKMEELRSKLNE
jgi:ubiquitin